MLGWNASADLMAEIKASIQPIQTHESLRQVLEHDFPRDCSALPISGGWGYTQADAIIFVRNQFKIPSAPDFVALEYHIAQKIIYEELIIFRPKDYRFSGIALQRSTQRLVEDSTRKYDVLDFTVTCWTDRHWNQLKLEWEDSGFGTRQDFDREAHTTKRNASQIKYDRHLWFDITDVFDQV